MAAAVAEIRRRMDAAAREAGRDPASVQLCAACKTHTPETIALSARLPRNSSEQNPPLLPRPLPFTSAP